METQTAPELLDVFANRVKALAELMNKPCIANQKERRQNPSDMFPIPGHLRELLPHFTTTSLDEEDDSQFVDDLWNTILEPFDVAARRGSRKPIPFKVSVKTAAPGYGPHGDRLLSAMAAARRPGERFVRLSELYAEIGGSREYELATQGPLINNPFFADALEVLASPLADTEIREAFDRKYRQTPPSALLRTKVILQRCELRSFCYDENFGSAVVGGMLHSIVHPQNKKERASLKYSDVWKVKGKNILEREMRVLVGQTIMEIEGDVSSFTSSEKNLWTAAITAAAKMEYSYRDGEPYIYLLFRGHLILAKLSHVIRLFVFINFRRMIYDEVAGDFYASEGGPLGVAFINTLANLVFAALQTALSRSVARYPTPITYEPQNGGDDFHSWSISRSEFQLEQVMLTVRSKVRKYIGEFSEFDVRLIRPHVTPSSDFMSLSLFCKKAVRVRVFTGRGGELTVRWQSQWALPLYSVLLEGPSFRNRHDFAEKARAYATSLETSIPWVPDRCLLIDYFLRLFAMLHGPVDRRVVLQRAYKVVPASFVLTELGFTEKADQLVRSIDLGLGPDERDLVDGWDARVLVLTRRGRLRKLVALHFDSWVYITCLPAELTHFDDVTAVIHKPEITLTSLSSLVRSCISLIDCRRVAGSYEF